MSEHNVNLPAEKLAHGINQVHVVRKTKRRDQGQQEIDIARGSEIVPEEGPKYRHVTNAEPPANRFKGGCRYAGIGETPRKRLG